MSFGQALQVVGLSLTVVTTGAWWVARMHRKWAEENRATAHINLQVAEENRSDAETVAAMAEANADAARKLAHLADRRGVSQDEIPRCQCGLLLRKTRPGEPGYPDGRICPMRPKQPGHDSWVPA